MDAPTFESSVASFSVLMIASCAASVVGLSLKFPPTKNWRDILFLVNVGSRGEMQQQ